MYEKIKGALCLMSDLDELIQHGEWERLVSPTQTDFTKSQRATTQPSPPAFTKEKGQMSYST